MRVLKYGCSALPCLQAFVAAIRDAASSHTIRGAIGNDASGLGLGGGGGGVGRGYGEGDGGGAGYDEIALFSRIEGGGDDDDDDDDGGNVEAVAGWRAAAPPAADAAPPLPSPSPSPLSLEDLERQANAAGDIVYKLINFVRGCDELKLDQV
jgi:hypothetical protein